MIFYVAGGWYFRDEAGERHGPYATAREARTKLRYYEDSLAEVL